MNRISITFKISISLACLLVSILLAAHTVGFFPDPGEEKVQSQIKLCETIAVQTSMAIQHGERELMKDSLRAMVLRNEDIAYARINHDDKSLAEFTHNNLPLTQIYKDQLTIVTVPIASNDQPWGSVELGLQKVNVASSHWLLGRLSPLLRLTLFCGCLAIPAYFVYLRRVLQHLDPSEVVPDRVRKTLDTLAEGLVVLDRDQRIVLANNALAVMLDSSPEELLARNIASFPWLFEDEELFAEELPWYLAMNQKRIVAGQVVQLTNEAGQKRTLRVNASPIDGANDECEGVLVSFDDVTLLEERNTALTSMLDKLRDSRDQIQRQNRELTVLATRDSLTGALNRRCFFEEFEKHWATAQKNRSPISCIMIDIDHFKSINDNFGHATGDTVLKEVVKIVEESIGKTGILSRYGGEEFCVLCPGSANDYAVRLGERIRSAIASKVIETVGTVTASLGVSAIEYGAGTPNDMLNEADSALYHSKRTGRNQTTSWGDIKDNTNAAEEQVDAGRISVEAVNALLVALGNRDAKTVEHCRRVAELCDEASENLFSQTERHLLKNAALLHDIGKICVPDSLLRKEGPLTSEEKAVIKSHILTGVDIVRATLGRDELADLIQYHHGDETKIPAPARLLTIVDAYDSMITDQSYRAGISKTEAINELKKRAGKQFDPSLVKHFVGFLTGENIAIDLISNKPGTKLPLEKQLEQLASALDERDHALVKELTRDITVAAAQLNVPAITELVEVLGASTKHDDQWIESVRTTVQLMDLCRITRQERGSKSSARSRNPKQRVAPRV